MPKKTPYDIVKSRYMTEKARVLGELKENKSNPSVAKCASPKYVFLVDLKRISRKLHKLLRKFTLRKISQLRL